MIENATKGIIDDTETLVPPYDLEEWEILGQPPPEEAPPGEPAETRGTRKAAAAGARNARGTRARRTRAS